jgi:hypothetical protein
MEKPEICNEKIDLGVKDGELTDPERSSRQNLVSFRARGRPEITINVNGMPISEAISSVVPCACSPIPNIKYRRYGASEKSSKSSRSGAEPRMVLHNPERGKINIPVSEIE